MNQSCYICILLLVALSINSCNKNKGDSELVNISKNLLDTDPDSSLLLLESIDFPEKLSPKDYAKYNQLMVMAHQRNKISIKEDTLIRYAVNYYRGRSEQEKEYVNSLLLLGNVYEEQDSILLAEECYNEVYGLSKKKNDTIFLGISALELGGLYKHQANYIQSVYWFKEAIGIYENTSNNEMKYQCMRQLADCYVLSDQPDSAFAIYNQVLNLIPLTRKGLRSDIYKNIAITYKLGKYYNKSLIFMQKSIDITPQESLYPMQYVILASIYEDMGQKDSSLYYNQTALKYAKEQNNLSLIHKVYDALFDIEHPNAYLNYILSRSISDPLYQKQKYDAVRYKKLYDVERVKKQNREDIIKLQRYLFFSFIIIIALIAYYSYKWNKKRREETLLTQEIEDKNNIINSIRNSLYKRLIIYQKMVRLSISPNRKKHKTFLKEYNKILFNDDNEFVFDWKTANDLSNNIFDSYSNKIKNLHTEINEIEERIIVLQKLGFNASEIALIEEKSIHTIYKYCSSIRKKLNIVEGESIVNFIDNLLKMTNL